MKNKYIKYSHLSEKKFKGIGRLFSDDLTISQMSGLSEISRVKLSGLIQKKIRRRIYQLVKKKTHCYQVT